MDLVAKTVKARVVFKCVGCEQTADEKDALQHKDTDHEKKVVETCDRSGKFPHEPQPK